MSPTHPLQHPTSPSEPLGTADPAAAPHGRRRAEAALRGGILGNYVDQLHIFLPLTALAPALPRLVGADALADTALLAMMATLLGRPIGAMVFGSLADRFGRTRITQIAIAGTAVCTAGIAAVPDHSVIGYATVLSILLLRFLGGMFLAGEYTSAIPLAMEWSQPRRRGLVSGLIMAMAPWAQATIAVGTIVLLAVLGPADYAAWGWRCSFAAGAAASVGVLVFYRRRVADAQRVPDPAPARGAQDTAADPAAGPRADGRPGSLRAILIGSLARPFWQVFALMSGLWLMTNMVVLQLGSAVTEGTVGSGVGAERQPLVMACAAVAQALVMSVTGHLSTLLGRRRFFIGAGLLAAVAGPAVWWLAAGSHGLLALCAAAALLQAVTVTAYGPVGAYLTERFPPHQRSVGYGTAYSVSIVIPALCPYWLPWLAAPLGSMTGAIMVVLVIGGILVALAGALGPELRGADLDRPVVGP
ncbi:MFS transporter [Rothia kristinae]|uniref:MFS transporter n=1 Tax=Rothia kristinae TaxID=37923 RepID=UPI0009E64BC9|nr:MFS transporter [Rothia kristinae]